MKASDYVVSFLYEQGVRHVFELPGGMITHLLHSFCEFKKIKVVTMHHEQSAAFAADAMGRMTRIPGIALATSGPGAINLLTGIGSAYFDSSPCVFITGQVNTNEIRPSGSRIRQLGFQEADILSMTASITKDRWQVRHARDLPYMLKQSFVVALEGRPGPVLIDIPMDVQRSELEIECTTLPN